jgi:hypothetical protein
VEVFLEIATRYVRRNFKALSRKSLDVGVRDKLRQQKIGDTALDKAFKNLLLIGYVETSKEEGFKLQFGHGRPVLSETGLKLWVEVSDASKIPAAGSELQAATTLVDSKAIEAGLFEVTGRLESIRAKLEENPDPARPSEAPFLAHESVVKLVSRRLRYLNWTQQRRAVFIRVGDVTMNPQGFVSWVEKPDLIAALQGANPEAFNGGVKPWKDATENSWIKKETLAGHGGLERFAFSQNGVALWRLLSDPDPLMEARVRLAVGVLGMLYLDDLGETAERRAKEYLDGLVGKYRKESGELPYVLGAVNDMFGRWLARPYAEKPEWMIRDYLTGLLRFDAVCSDHDTRWTFHSLLSQMYGFALGANASLAVFEMNVRTRKAERKV